MSEPPEGGFIFGMPDPEEMQRRHAEHVATVQMLNEDFRNKLRDLYRNIKPEQLHTLRLILHRAQVPEDGIQYLAFLEGMAMTYLELVHDVCGSCGRNHEIESLGIDCQPMKVPSE